MGAPRRRPAAEPTAEPVVVRLALTCGALLFVLLFVGVPLAAVFAQALARGAAGYLAALREPDALAAVRLTLVVALIAVPLNVVFGVAAAWAVARFQFRGKRVLVTLIDLPFAVSPVVSGMAFVLLAGPRGLLGPWLEALGVRVIYALPGIVLATMFVTAPLVARVLIPLMQEQGAEEEECAAVLGAGGWQTFRRVTLPNIRWGLLYGVVLCGARAVGEFGAVSVVSGLVRGVTTTVPLHVEILYDEYNFTAAFAVASLLTLVAVAALGAKRLLERRAGRAA